MRLAPSFARGVLVLGAFALAAPASDRLAQAQDELAIRDDGANQVVRELAAPAGPFRKLAPGVETVIHPDRNSEETFSRHDLVEVLAYDANFGERPYSKGRATAKDVAFNHDVWCLELTFKPVRFVEVDVPTDEGRFERKLVWYLVYHVRHPGQILRRTVTDRGQAKAELVAFAEPIRFVPTFRLESWDTKKSYPDRYLPLALPLIQNREDPNRPLLDSVSIVGEIQASTPDADNSVWGVATWSDIDPATDHFSIYIQGLTNAYRWEDAKDGDAYVYRSGQPVGTGRTLLEKTLRLNFWRPSDRLFEHEDEIRFGFWKHAGDDRFGLAPNERVDYLWIYR